MGLGRLGASRTWAVLLGTGLLMGWVAPGLGQMRLAQVEAASEVEAIEPFTIEGILDENSDVLEQDGTYFNAHPFEGQAGQSVEIQLISNDFNTYLLLVSPDGTLLSQNDDGSEGTNNSRIVVSLPTTGTYTIVANTYAAGETGLYTLSLKPAPNQAVAAEALQRVTELNQQVTELYQAGRYQEVIPLAEEALDIFREQLGTRHLDVATSLNNLALLYQDQGRYGEAEPRFLESLDILREQLGARHPDVATSLNNLALLYQDQGRYGEAEPLHQEALDIRRQQLGDRHLDVAASLNNLAELYRVQGRYGEAEPLHQEALDIFREQLGTRHPDVATSLNNLASLYQDQGRYGEAEPRYREALDIRRQQLGGV